MPHTAPRVLRAALRVSPPALLQEPRKPAGRRRSKPAYARAMTTDRCLMLQSAMSPTARCGREGALSGEAHPVLGPRQLGGRLTFGGHAYPRPRGTTASPRYSLAAVPFYRESEGSPTARTRPVSH